VEPITAFLWNVFQNVLGNRVDAYFFDRRSAVEPATLIGDQGQPKSIAEDAEIKPAVRSRFETFDAHFDIERLLTYVEQPMVHLLIEDQPSSAYNLPGYVLESRMTGEWFVFSRGRLSLEGDGGGHRNMRGVTELLHEKQTKIVGWVIQKNDMDRLEEGVLLWPEAKKDLVPLLSYRVDDDAWKWASIKREFDKLTRRRA
jgi:hypothetical protein